jgi:hypothetical protein
VNVIDAVNTSTIHENQHKVILATNPPEEAAK